MTRTHITINTRDVPPAVLHEYAEHLSYGEFHTKMRQHYDPLFKLPRIKDGLALYIVDNGDHWALTYAACQADAIVMVDQPPFDHIRVDKDLIVITPPRKRAAIRYKPTQEA